MNKPTLDRMTFEFSQEANCISDEDEYLTIECESSLGIDNDGECFFVLKTEKWSIDDEKDLKELFDRISTVFLSSAGKNKEE